MKARFAPRDGISTWHAEKQSRRRRLLRLQCGRRHRRRAVASVRSSSRARPVLPCRAHYAAAPRRYRSMSAYASRGNALIEISASRACAWQLQHDSRWLSAHGVVATWRRLFASTSIISVRSSARQKLARIEKLARRSIIISALVNGGICSSAWRSMAI